MKAPRCVFRLAAGPRVGFGHLMRARALARALGVAPVVSIRGGAAARRAARALGCRIAGDDRALAGADVLVVDDPSGVHRGRWLRRARRAGVATVAILDEAVTQAHADLVVNGGVACASTSTDWRLTGPSFYILDERIGRVRRPAKTRAGAGRQARRVLVALGGGEHVRLAARRLVAAVHAKSPNARIDVAAGFVGGRPPALPGARWVVRRRGLSRSLAAADVAIVAGGVTLYEACALGVATVCLAVTAAQRRAIRGFAAAGAVIDGGGPRLDASTARRTADHVARLLGDRGARRLQGSRARRLVDARGAARVARRVRALAARGGSTP